MIMSDQQPKCPECGKDEDIVQACGHCGYVYPEDENVATKWYEVIFCIAIILFVITFFIWCFNLAIDREHTGTLASYFVNEYRFVIDVFTRLI